MLPPLTQTRELSGMDWIGGEIAFFAGVGLQIIKFLAVDERKVDLTIPHGFKEVKELGYLGGHTLGELIGIEQSATAGALAKRGRPNLTIHLERVDELQARAASSVLPRAMGQPDPGES